MRALDNLEKVMGVPEWLLPEWLLLSGEAVYEQRKRQASFSKMTFLLNVWSLARELAM